MGKFWVLLLVFALFVSGCTNNVSKEQSQPVDLAAEEKNNYEQIREDDMIQMNEPPEMQIDMNHEYFATLETNLGNIKIKFFPKEAPKTVNNFVVLGRKGFYDGTIFHRVIDGFMIQGGDPEGTGIGGPGYQFEDEKNSLRHTKGKISMANAGPNTNGSQFFIVIAQETPWLDGMHTIFGEVVEGIETVDKIALIETDPQDRPVTEIKLNKVTIEEK